MKIFRAVNPKVAAMMKFFDDKDSSAGDNMKEMFHMMTAESERVCVSVIFDGDELVGHTCGYKHDDKDFMWSFNSWVKKGIDKEFAIKCLDIVKQWSIDTFDIHNMRCETFRNPEAMKRAYDWDKYSTIMELLF